MSPCWTVDFDFLSYRHIRLPPDEDALGDL